MMENDSNNNFFFCVWKFTSKTWLMTTLSLIFTPIKYNKLLKAQLW